MDLSVLQFYNTRDLFGLAPLRSDFAKMMVLKFLTATNHTQIQATSRKPNSN